MATSRIVISAKTWPDSGLGEIREYYASTEECADCDLHFRMLAEEDDPGGEPPTLTQV